MMHRQSYPRFLQSEMFHAVLQTTYAYNPNSPKPPIPPNSNRNSSSSSSSSTTNADQTAITTNKTCKGTQQEKSPSPSLSKKKIRPQENVQTQPTKQESQPYLKPTDNSDLSTLSVKTQQYSTIASSINEKTNPPVPTNRPKKQIATARPRSAATMFSENQGKQLDRHNSMPSTQKTPSELHKMKMENKLAARNSTKI